MSDQLQTQEMLEAIENELHRSVADPGESELTQYYSMLAYHLGWEGEGAGPEARGKRIRPLLVLLTCAAAGGNWKDALPAAASVELVHNFSLIHDDIQDDSPLRRGRETIWRRWGIPQAINAGDAMFTLAHLSLLRLEETTSPEITTRAANTLHQACLQLTKQIHFVPIDAFDPNLVQVLLGKVESRYTKHIQGTYLQTVRVFG